MAGKSLPNHFPGGPEAASKPLLISFDPGPKAGWVIANKESGQIINFGVLHYPDDQVQLIRDPQFPVADIGLALIEQYRVSIRREHGGYNHDWDPVVTARSIGMVHAFAQIWEMEVYYVERSALNIGRTVAELPTKLQRGVLKDVEAAAAHVAAFLHQGAPLPMNPRTGKRVSLGTSKQTARSQSVPLTNLPDLS